MPTTDDTRDSESHGQDIVELDYQTDARTVRFELDEEIYPRATIFGAAYIFIDRCYVFLTRPADKKVGVQLKTKSADVAAGTPEELAGEFANELLNQLLRFNLAESTAEIRKYYMARAFFGLTGNPSIDALLMELDDEELDDDAFENDALDIAVPWEKKHQGDGQPREDGKSEDKVTDRDSAPEAGDE
jgi:His-Xaa-Ser system protein HxsD